MVPETASHPELPTNNSVRTAHVALAWLCSAHMFLVDLVRLQRPRWKGRGHGNVVMIGEEVNYR